MTSDTQIIRDKNIFYRIKSFLQNKDTKEAITLYANHLLVICMFFLPIYKQPISSIGMVTLVFLFLIRGDYKYYLKEAVSNRIVQACIIIFLVHAIWLLGSDNIKLGKDMVANSRYFLFSIIILFFADKLFIKKFLFAFILGMLSSEILSYLIHFEIVPYRLEILDKIIYKAQGLNNPTPFLVHYEYNTLLSVVVGILLYNLLANKNRLYIKLISIFFIATASINLILIGGRIGYIAYIAVIFLTLFMIYRKKFFKIALPTAMIGLSIFFCTAYNSGGLFQERIDSVVSDYNEMSKEDDNINTSVGLRIFMWKYGLEVIQNNFLFGVGTGDQMPSIKEVASDKHAKYIIFHHPHNAYIEYFLQFGIFGLIALLNLFYQVYRVKIEDVSTRVYLHIINISFLVFMLTNRFSRYMILVFLLLTLTVSTKYIYLKNREIIYNNRTFIFYTLFILLFFLRGL